MSEQFRIYRETALPGTLLPYSIYLIAPAARSGYVEMYVTGSSASTVRRIIDTEQVNTLITAAIDGIGILEVVSNIAARDELAPTKNTQVLVIDATGDSTVASGSATYVYRLSTTSWIKVSESESLDVTLSWANLADKPTSTIANIDDAVDKRHTHTNKTELDLIGQDSEGKLTYNGSRPVIDWTSSGW